MEKHIALFIGTLTTLLAVVNPLEALSIFLSLSKDKSDHDRRKLAFRSCKFALLLIISFLLFGTIVLEIFGVDLAMVRTVGGIILMKIGFDLFNSGANMEDSKRVSSGDNQGDPAFVPLAMPIMFGPGVLATVLGMTSFKSATEEIISTIVIAVAAVVCMLVIYITLTYAHKIVNRIGNKGIDAATRIIGFFVACMGMGLIFHGVQEFVKDFLK